MAIKFTYKCLSKAVRGKKRKSELYQTITLMVVFSVFHHSTTYVLICSFFTQLKFQIQFKINKTPIYLLNSISKEAENLQDFFLSCIIFQLIFNAFRIFSPDFSYFLISVSQCDFARCFSLCLVPHLNHKAILCLLPLGRNLKAENIGGKEFLIDF